MTHSTGTPLSRSVRQIESVWEPIKRMVRSLFCDWPIGGPMYAARWLFDTWVCNDITSAIFRISNELIRLSLTLSRHELISRGSIYHNLRSWGRVSDRVINPFPASGCVRTRMTPRPRPSSVVVADFDRCRATNQPTTHEQRNSISLVSNKTS